MAATDLGRTESKNLRRKSTAAIEWRTIPPTIKVRHKKRPPPITIQCAPPPRSTELPYPELFYLHQLKAIIRATRMDTRSSQLLDRCHECDNRFLHIHMHTLDVFCSNGHTCKGVSRERYRGAGTPRVVLCYSRFSTISKSAR